MQHLLFFSFFLLVFLSSRAKIKLLNKVCFFYFLIFIFIFLSLRVDYGNDYSAYEYIFSAIKSGSPSHGQSDRLFYFLNVSMPSFRGLLIFISLLYVVVLYIVINRWVSNSYFYLFSIFLILNPYLFFIHASALRQTIAMLFFLLAVLFLEKKRYVTYCLFVSVACGFHLSAMVLFLIPFFINHTRISIKWIVIFFVVIIFMSTSGLFVTGVEFVVNAYFPLFISYLSEVIQPNPRTILISLLFLVFNILAYSRCDDDKVLVCKLALLSSLISILYFVFPMISRFDIYFGLFSLVSVIHLIEKLRGDVNRFFIAALIFFLFLLRYVSFFNTPLWESFAVYKTII